MRRLLVIGGVCAALAAAVFPSAAAGLTQRLLPGITYTRELRQGAAGPIVVHVVSGPRPGGLYELAPVLSNERIVGRETVSEMQRRLSPFATAVGINGDLFNFETGHPSGLLVQGGTVLSRPLGGRSSLGIGLDGLLRIGRVKFLGSYQLGISPRNPLHQFNRPLEDVGVSLFTPAWGERTPSAEGAFEVVLAGVGPITPNADVAGTIAEVRSGGDHPIAAGSVVLQGTGYWADRLLFEAQVGQQAVVRVTLDPWWPEVAAAIGGGPVIVRAGQAIGNAKEEFTSEQLEPRHPRTAVGQTADGRILLVVVDGRSAESAGITIPELALEMVRLGAVEAMALDAGGSTTLAFDGTVLNTPSDGAERPVGDALMFLYRGVYLPPPTATIVSPNGDGFADATEIGYKLVRPATVDAKLIAPDGSIAFQEAAAKDPGWYPITITPPAEGQAPLTEGRWRWVVVATDADGLVSGGEQRFTVNNTLAALRLTKRTLRVHARRGGVMRLRFRVTRPASVQVRVEDGNGAVVRRLVQRRLEQGLAEVRWDGRVRGRNVAAEGRYRLRVIAVNPVGKAELFGDVKVVRSAPVFSVE